MIERVSDIGKLSRLSDALDSFRCCKDEDIETFLRQKAFTFLERGWCSVYLIVDEAAFDKGEIKVEAYFTLSHKCLLSGGISKERVKNVSGFKNSESIHFVLIGQLGKYIEKTDDEIFNCADITSKEILDYAFEIIQASSNLIPCRCALVECGDNPKVHKVYTDYGFSEFQFDGEHYQFYKRI